MPRVPRVADFDGIRRSNKIAEETGYIEGLVEQGEVTLFLGFASEQ